MSDPATQPRVLALASSAGHDFSKARRRTLELIEGHGVEGDAHCGVTVKHRSRVAKDPTQPNLRQVHLIQSELLDEVRGHGFDVEPGQLGENVSTRGIDLLRLPTGARLEIGRNAEIEITGLRNPCIQIDRFRPGLLGQVLVRDAAGEMIRRAGVMAIVCRSGEIAENDSIRVLLPPEPHRQLERV